MNPKFSKSEEKREIHVQVINAFFFSVLPTLALPFGYSPTRLSLNNPVGELGVEPRVFECKH
jgi:hypothetical protein